MTKISYFICKGVSCIYNTNNKIIRHSVPKLHDPLSGPSEPGGPRGALPPTSPPSPPTPPPPPPPHPPPPSPTFWLLIFFIINDSKNKLRKLSVLKTEIRYLLRKKFFNKTSNIRIYNWHQTVQWLCFSIRIIGKNNRF